MSTAIRAQKRANKRARRRAEKNLYDSVAEGSSELIIRRYSSSFGLAAKLLSEPVRTQVRNIYALVRVADEIVDNPDSSISLESRITMLDWLHQDVRHALTCGYSANLAVHSFARTALESGIGTDLIDPFFESMRMDLDTAVHTPESFGRYVYGSAEVVGLMCLRVFLAQDTASEVGSRAAERDYERLTPGARRLGAAFQKLNFLRDLADDHGQLGRCYFPGIDVDEFNDADRDRLLADIATDLDAAAAVIPRLPDNSRRAVRVAHATFAELADRLQCTPAAEIRHTRVRVPDSRKARIVVREFSGGR